MFDDFRACTKVFRNPDDFAEVVNNPRDCAKIFGDEFGLEVITTKGSGCDQSTGQARVPGQPAHPV